MEIRSNYPHVGELRNNLIHSYNFQESTQWNGSHLPLPSQIGSGGLYLFATHSLQFMRGNWSCNQPTLFSSTNQVGQYKLIDLRLNDSGQANSAYLEGRKKYEWDVTKVNGMRLFFPEKYLNNPGSSTLDKFQLYCYDPNISRLVAEILSLTPSSIEDCIKIEWKALEFSYYFIEYLNKQDVARHFYEIPPKHIRAIRLAQNILDNNYNENISIENLSKKVNLNCQYLKEGFKRVVGCTIKQYIIKLRLEKAQSMVLMEDTPVSEICHKVGYSNQGYFIKQYKKVYGLTPLQHRMQRAKSAQTGRLGSPYLL